jgi:membrane protease YdiL (CAAX protease family)
LMLIARRGRGEPLTVGAAPLPPPWRGRLGVAVLMRGGAIGILLTLAFLLVEVDDPLVRLSTMPIASLPLLVIAQRHLLNPAGLSFADGLGLRPISAGWARLVPAVLSLVAAGLMGEWGLGLLAEWLDLSSHWTEWFDTDLVWGGTPVLVVSLLEFVVLAPVLEEIAFRGLVFGTLRRKFRWGTSAILSGAIFAIAHGYGVLGFMSVFWSGVLWAWIYEKTGSLLPGIIAHALNNLLVCLTIIWLLRY